MKLSIKQLGTFMILCIMALTPMVSQAQSVKSVTNSAIVPATGESTAKWWQWAVAIPAGSNPILSDITTDPTGELCGVNQSGVVWFLAGTAGGSVKRNCTIPFGKTILFPIITVEWSTSEAQSLGNNCFVSGVISGTNRKALQACAENGTDHVNFTEADIDGINVPNLDNYRVQSPLFHFNAVQDNVFGIPPGPSQAVSDGFWILISPLSKGKHEIHFHGTAPFPELGFTFDTEVTYNISIV